VLCLLSFKRASMGTSHRLHPVMSLLSKIFIP
jgi:hypothetical protein